VRLNHVTLGATDVERSIADPKRSPAHSIGLNSSTA